MATIPAHLSMSEIDAGRRAAADPVAKSHFHALWLWSSGYEVEEVAELMLFSTRWVRALVKHTTRAGRIRSATSASTTDRTRPF